jgi:hypothetical protein
LIFGSWMRGFALKAGSPSYWAQQMNIYSPVVLNSRSEASYYGKSNP